jgi:hypothetical protein
MGQQQVLLVMLTVILVGVAVMVGTQMFQDQAADSNLDSVCADLIALANKAQQHYRKPLALGGGGESFALLTANASGLAYLTTQPSNGNGTYGISSAGTSTTVALRGDGSFDGDGDGSYVAAQIQVWADSSQLAVLNR